MLLVFDFDHSFINDDSDQFLVKHLLPPPVHEQVVTRLSAYESTPPATAQSPSFSMTEYPLTTGGDENDHDTDGQGTSSNTTRTPSPAATVSPTAAIIQPHDDHTILAQMPRPVPTQWTDRMNWLFDLVHRLTPTTDHAALPSKLRSLMRDIPFSSAFDELIRRDVHDFRRQGVDTDFVILSDANTEFIQAFFDSRPELLGVHGRVHVISNPARVDPTTGRLMINRYSRRHGDAQPEEQHQCQSGYCAVNMCKGRELVKFIKYRQQHQRRPHAQTGVVQLPSHHSWNDLSPATDHHASSKLDAIQCHYDMVVYVGDGKNDYCPMTRLRPHDLACIRRHRALERLVDGGKIAQPDIQARRVYWHESDTVREAICEWVKKNVQK